MTTLRRRVLRTAAVGLLVASFGADVAQQDAAAAALPAVAHPVTFVDTFNSRTLTGWTKHDEGTVAGPSAWGVDAANRLQQASNIYGGSTAASEISRPGTELVAGAADWKNYDWTVTVRPLDDDDVGVVFRFGDTDNYYRFSMSRQQSYQRLVKKVNGRFTLLARNGRAYTSNTPYVIRTLAVGSRIVVSVDGVVVFDVTDTSLTRGRIGVYTWGSSMTKFDSVRARVEAADDAFTVAVVPDTQYESRSYPGMLTTRLSWLAAHRADLRLAMVLQVGDVVDTTSDATQWSRASAGFRRLNGKVPFVVAAGNHDMFTYADPAAPHAITRAPFNRFVSGFSDATPSGTYRPGDYLDTYSLFSAGGVDLLVINLEFGADDRRLAWAGQVADRYPGRHVLLLTHDYLSEKNALRGSDPADLYLPTSYYASMNDGVDMWQELVRRHPNIQMVLSGHVIAPVSSTTPYSVGRLVSTDLAGRSVYQTMANYSRWSPAGRGYLRLLRFSPSRRTVAVTTYSPYENASLTDGRNRFTFSGVDLGAWAA